MSSSLPVSRIKTIMKSSPEVEQISHDAALLVGRATELFINFLTIEACARSTNVKKLDYKDVAEIVQSDDRLDFLREMVPKKITVRQFKEILKRKKKQIIKTNSNGNCNESVSNESEEDDDSNSDEQEESSSLSEEDEEN